MLQYTRAIIPYIPIYKQSDIAHFPLPTHIALSRLYLLIATPFQFPLNALLTIYKTKFHRSINRINFSNQLSASTKKKSIDLNELLDVFRVAINLNSRPFPLQFTFYCIFIWYNVVALRICTPYIPPYSCTFIGRCYGLQIGGTGKRYQKTFLKVYETGFLNLYSIINITT